MSFKSVKMRKIISMLLVVVVLLTSIQAPQAQAGYKSNNDNEEEIYVGEGYEINFKVTSQWNDGFNASITVRNTGDTVIDNWALGFDMPHEITDIWNGAIEYEEEGYYIVKNAGHNQDINVN